LVLESEAELDLNTQILMVLEAIYRGAGFERVIFAFLNGDRSRIEGRLGLGDDVDELIRRFSFRMSVSGGPVSQTLICKRSELVDATREKTNQIARLFGCASYGLYPIVVAGQTVGAMYMESGKPLPDLNRELLDQLRDALAKVFAKGRPVAQRRTLSE
jgi:hypothetical protein